MSDGSVIFTQPIIKGSPYTKMLPDGCALVLEGGGTRGFYSAGVFEAFMGAGIMFPYIIGVSAGAANAMSFWTVGLAPRFQSKNPLQTATNSMWSY